mgnify:CR=1 FL=1
MIEKILTGRTKGLFFLLSDFLNRHHESLKDGWQKVYTFSSPWHFKKNSIITLFGNVLFDTSFRDDNCDGDIHSYYSGNFDEAYYLATDNLQLLNGKELIIVEFRKPLEKTNCHRELFRKINGGDQIFVENVYFLEENTDLNRTDKNNLTSIQNHFNKLAPIKYLEMQH